MMKNLCGFFRWRLLIVIGMLIVGIGFPLSSQQLSDFKLTVENGDGHCINDMWIKINAKRVTSLQDGEKEYQLTYNLKNKETGNMVFPDAESTPQNDFQGLHAGTYLPIVYLKVINQGAEGGEINTKHDLPEVSGKTTYVAPAIDGKLVRMPLPYYKEDENGPAKENTGIISFSMIEGSSKCSVILKKYPEGFKAEAKRFITKGKKITYYGVVPGEYIFTLYDEDCNYSIGDRAFDVEYIENPYPVADGEWPVHNFFSQTEDMRLHHCGWFSVSLFGRIKDNFPKNPDIAPYFASMDTVAKYYQYAIYSDYLKKKGKPKVFHNFFEPDSPEHPYWGIRDDEQTFTIKKELSPNWYEYRLYCYVEYPFAELSENSKKLCCEDSCGELLFLSMEEF